MRTATAVLVLLIGGTSSAAAPRQSVELFPGGAELAATWKPSEHVWGLWGALVLAQGITLAIPGGAFLGLAYDNAQLAATFPGQAAAERAANDQLLIGGALIAFAAACIVTAAFMFVYQARGTWHEDAYWQSR